MKIQLNNKQNIFFCSDPHYGHSGIVLGTSNWDNKSGCRDFETLEQHDLQLVKNINDTVGVNDILFCNGDWSFGSYKTGENITNIRKFREQINCRNIYLILGNHDLEIQSNKDNTRELFKCVKNYLEIIVLEEPKEQGQKGIRQKIVLSHYSHRVWNNVHNGVWMLFGHSHNNLQGVEGKSMDVGFDTRKEFKPYSYQEIKEIMATKEIIKIDHHE